MTISWIPGTQTGSRKVIGTTERKVWYGVGAVVSLVAMGAATLGFRWGWDETETQNQTYQESINRIVVPDTVSGDVRIVGDAEPGTVRVERVVQWENGFGDNKPKILETFSGQTLTIGRDCDDCSIDYVIHVPEGVGGSVQSTSGDVRLSGLSGNFTISTTSGDLEVANHDGDVDAEVTSGDIELNGVSGTITAEASSGEISVDNATGPSVTATVTSGDIDLEFSTAPELVKAEANSGEISIEVPGNESYAILTDADSGEVEVTAPNDPNSDRSITASTSSGDITIE